MKSISLGLAVLGLFVVASVSNAQLFNVEVGGGAGTDIAITAVGEQSAGALNLLSPAGHLVENAAGVDPFGTRIDALAPAQYSYAKLGGKVTFADGTTTVMNVGYNLGAAGADAPSDFAIQWDTPENTAGTTVSFVPEPATGLMAIFAGIGMLGFRRRKR